MENYKTLALVLINDHINDVQGWDASKTRVDILNDLLDDTQNVFGNMDGSRTCNTWQAEKFINESNAIWDDDIRDLFNEIDDKYFIETLARGAETLDVVILELLAPHVIGEMLNKLAVLGLVTRGKRNSL